MLRTLRARLASDTASVLAGNVGSVLARFGLNIAIARLAGAHEMGLYVALGALAIIVVRLSDCGLPNAVVYFSRLERSAAHRCLLVCLAHCAVVLPLSVALLYAAASFGLAELSQTDNLFSLLVSLGALATMQLLNSLFQQLLITFERFNVYCVGMLMSPALAVTLCLALGGPLEVRDLVLITLLGETLAAVLTFAILWWQALPAVPSAPPVVTIGDLYSYGLKTYFGTAVKAIGQRGDRLILAWFVPSSMVAAYAIAIALRDAAALPINAHATVLRNRFIDVASKHDRMPLGKALYREVARWFILMAAAASAFAALTPWLVPSIYGEQLRPAVPLFGILFGTLPTLVVAAFCSTAMLARRRAGAVGAGYLAGAAMNCIGLYAGALTGGAIGAAWGALVASLVSAAWWLVAARIRPADDRP